jgi:hypothetical protein
LTHICSFLLYKWTALPSFGYHYVIKNLSSIQASYPAWNQKMEV